MPTDFTTLTPDAMLGAVEEAVGKRLLGFAHPHHSYINRVYELQTVAGERLIAKFYRPGRWTRDALLDEHRFVLDCAAEDIPVVAPLPLGHGSTLGEAEGIWFAVFPKRWGRPYEATCEEDWRRLGRILARMHVVGARGPAPNRVVMHPAHSLRADIDHLQSGDFVPAKQRDAFFRIAEEIAAAITPAFAGVALQRIHGDCHCQNILERPGEGLMLIDFDDMAVGPVVQDLWMLLPGRLDDAPREVQLVLDGYLSFRDVDRRTLRLVEPLRAMRMLYFLAWCSRQLADPNYRSKFPDWGTEAFWRQQTADLRSQRDAILERCAKL